MFNGIRNFFRYYTPGIIMLVLVFGIYYVIQFVYSPYLVMGTSMEPNYHEGDIVKTEPADADLLVRGTVVIIKRSRWRRIIKRIEGMPGDTIGLDDGGTYTLKPDEYFVLGDNLDESYDSRFFGPVKRDDITGIVDKKIFSTVK